MKLNVKIKATTDGQYLAWCPPLPGCRAQGPSPAGAQDKLAEAVRGYLASLDLSERQLEFVAGELDEAVIRS
jgi:predicted RNase H-like HicB family nuclease